MLASYTGSLFQIQRASDNATINISSLPNGLANTSTATSFCASTSCTITEIYDQLHSPTAGNNLPAVTPAPYGTVTLPNGQTVPHANISSTEKYRNRTSTVGMPTGAASTTEYAVIGTDANATCCGFYGNVESTVADTGNGHMFELAFSTGAEGTLGFSANASGPWPGVDWENGVYLFGPSPTSTYPFVSTLAKFNGTTNTWALKAGDATGPNSLNLLYSGAVPHGYTASFEGGLSLGEGGDGSPAPVDFLEGAVISGATTNATDVALQNNIGQFFGSGGNNDVYTAPDAPYALNLIDAAYTPWLTSEWALASGATSNAAIDPLSNSQAVLVTGTAGSQYAGIHESVPYALVNGTAYTYALAVKMTTGALVFPASSVISTNEFAVVIDTNACAVHEGGWSTGTPTSLSAVQNGNWCTVTMGFISPGSATINVYVDPPIVNANSNPSWNRSAQTVGLSATFYDPTLYYQ
jgi:hypothetical protein